MCFLSRSFESSITPNSSCGSQESIQKRLNQAQGAGGVKKKGIKSSIGRLFGKKDKVNQVFSFCMFYINWLFGYYVMLMLFVKANEAFQN